MRLLLRHIQTRRYYAGEEQWTESATDALDFQAPDTALDFVSQEGLEGMEVVLDFGDPTFAVPLKIVGLGI